MPSQADLHPRALLLDALINAKLGSKRTEEQRIAYRIGKELGSRRDVAQLKGKLVVLTQGDRPHMFAEVGDEAGRARMQRYADRELADEPHEFKLIHSDAVKAATSRLYGVPEWDESKHPRDEHGRFM